MTYRWLSRDEYNDLVRGDDIIMINEYFLERLKKENTNLLVRARVIKAYEELVNRLNRVDNLVKVHYTKVVISSSGKIMISKQPGAKAILFQCGSKSFYCDSKFLPSEEYNGHRFVNMYDPEERVVQDIWLDGEGTVNLDDWTLTSKSTVVTYTLQGFVNELRMRYGMDIKSITSQDIANELNAYVIWVSIHGEKYHNRPDNYNKVIIMDNQERLIKLYVDKVINPTIISNTDPIGIPSYIRSALSEYAPTPAAPSLIPKNNGVFEMIASTKIFIDMKNNRMWDLRNNKSALAISEMPFLGGESIEKTKGSWVLASDLQYYMKPRDRGRMINVAEEYDAALPFSQFVDIMDEYLRELPSYGDKERNDTIAKDILATRSTLAEMATKVLLKLYVSRSDMKLKSHLSLLEGMEKAISLLDDLDDRRRAGEEMNLSRDHMHIILDKTPDIVFYSTKQERLVILDITVVAGNRDERAFDKTEKYKPMATYLSNNGIPTMCYGYAIDSTDVMTGITRFLDDFDDGFDEDEVLDYEIFVSDMVARMTQEYRECSSIFSFHSLQGKSQEIKAFIDGVTEKEIEDTKDMLKHVVNTGNASLEVPTEETLRNYMQASVNASAKVEPYDLDPAKYAQSRREMYERYEELAQALVTKNDKDEIPFEHPVNTIDIYEEPNVLKNVGKFLRECTELDEMIHPLSCGLRHVFTKAKIKRPKTKQVEDMVERKQNHYCVPYKSFSDKVASRYDIGSRAKARVEKKLANASVGPYIRIHGEQRNKLIKAHLTDGNGADKVKEWESFKPKNWNTYDEISTHASRIKHVNDMNIENAANELSDELNISVEPNLPDIALKLLEHGSTSVMPTDLEFYVHELPDLKKCMLSEATENDFKYVSLNPDVNKAVLRKVGEHFGPYDEDKCVKYLQSKYRKDGPDSTNHRKSLDDYLNNINTACRVLATVKRRSTIMIIPYGNNNFWLAYSIDSGSSWLIEQITYHIDKSHLISSSTEIPSEDDVGYWRITKARRFRNSVLSHLAGKLSISIPVAVAGVMETVEQPSIDIQNVIEGMILSIVLNQRTDVGNVVTDSNTTPQFEGSTGCKNIEIAIKGFSLHGTHAGALYNYYNFMGRLRVATAQRSDTGASTELSDDNRTTNFFVPEQDCSSLLQNISAISSIKGLLAKNQIDKADAQMAVALAPLDAECREIRTKRVKKRGKTLKTKEDIEKWIETQLHKSKNDDFAAIYPYITATSLANTWVQNRDYLEKEISKKLTIHRDFLHFLTTKQGISIGPGLISIKEDGTSYQVKRMKKLFVRIEMEEKDCISLYEKALDDFTKSGACAFDMENKGQNTKPDREFFICCAIGYIAIMSEYVCKCISSTDKGNMLAVQRTDRAQHIQDRLTSSLKIVSDKLKKVVHIVIDMSKYSTGDALCRHAATMYHLLNEDNGFPKRIAILMSLGLMTNFKRFVKLPDNVVRRIEVYDKAIRSKADKKKWESESPIPSKKSRKKKSNLNRTEFVPTEVQEHYKFGSRILLNTFFQHRKWDTYNGRYAQFEAGWCQGNLNTFCGLMQGCFINHTLQKIISQFTDMSTDDEAIEELRAAIDEEDTGGEEPTKNVYLNSVISSNNTTVETAKEIIRIRFRDSLIVKPLAKVVYNHNADDMLFTAIVAGKSSALRCLTNLIMILLTMTGMTVNKKKSYMTTTGELIGMNFQDDRISTCPMRQLVPSLHAINQSVSNCIYSSVNAIHTACAQGAGYTMGALACTMSSRYYKRLMKKHRKELQEDGIDPDILPMAHGFTMPDPVLIMVLGPAADVDIAMQYPSIAHKIISAKSECVLEEETLEDEENWSDVITYNEMTKLGGFRIADEYSAESRVTMNSMLSKKHNRNITTLKDELAETYPLIMLVEPAVPELEEYYNIFYLTKPSIVSALGPSPESKKLDSYVKSISGHCYQYHPVDEGIQREVQDDYMEKSSTKPPPKITSNMMPGDEIICEARSWFNLTHLKRLQDMDDPPMSMVNIYVKELNFVQNKKISGMETKEIIEYMINVAMRSKMGVRSKFKCKLSQVLRDVLKREIVGNMPGSKRGYAEFDIDRLLTIMYPGTIDILKYLENTPISWRPSAYAREGSTPKIERYRSLAISEKKLNVLYHNIPWLLMRMFDENMYNKHVEYGKGIPEKDEQEYIDSAHKLEQVLLQIGFDKAKPAKKARILLDMTQRITGPTLATGVRLEVCPGSPDYIILSILSDHHEYASKEIYHKPSAIALNKSGSIYNFVRNYSPLDLSLNWIISLTSWMNKVPIVTDRLSVIEYVLYYVAKLKREEDVNAHLSEEHVVASFDNACKSNKAVILSKSSTKPKVEGLFNLCKKDKKIHITLFQTDPGYVTKCSEEIKLVLKSLYFNVEGMQQTPNFELIKVSEIVTSPGSWYLIQEMQNHALRLLFIRADRKEKVMSLNVDVVEAKRKSVYKWSGCELKRNNASFDIPKESKLIPYADHKVRLALDHHAAFIEGDISELLNAGNKFRSLRPYFSMSPREPIEMYRLMKKEFKEHTADFQRADVISATYRIKKSFAPTTRLDRSVFGGNYKVQVSRTRMMEFAIFKFLDILGPSDILGVVGSNHSLKDYAFLWYFISKLERFDLGSGPDISTMGSVELTEFFSSFFRGGV
jgi:hypothetical protein